MEPIKPIGGHQQLCKGSEDTRIADNQQGLYFAKDIRDVKRLPLNKLTCESTDMRQSKGTDAASKPHQKFDLDELDTMPFMVE